MWSNLQHTPSVLTSAVIAQSLRDKRKNNQINVPWPDNGISIPGICRIFTRGTKTLAPEAHDPASDSWTVPHLLNLKMDYEVLVNKYECKVQEMYTVQDHPPPPSEFLLLPPLNSLYKDHVRNQELPGLSRGILDRLCHRRNALGDVTVATPWVIISLS